MSAQINNDPLLDEIFGTPPEKVDPSYDVLDDIFPKCEQLGVGVVVGAPYASGILATGAVDGAKYKYANATQEVLQKVRAIEGLCNDHKIPLKAAALQFPLGHSLVASIIPGTFQPA